MIGALLAVGLGVVALGGVVAATRRGFAVGLGLQAAGMATVGFAGFWALAPGNPSGEGLR